MLILDAGHSVAVLRFSPDSRNLYTGSGFRFDLGYPQIVSPTIDVWSTSDGSRRVIDIPAGTTWAEPNELAVRPDGGRAWLALEGTALTVDLAKGEVRPAENLPPANRVVISQDGHKQVVLTQETEDYRLTGRAADGSGWTLPLEPDSYELGGFLSDGDRFVTVSQKRIRVHRFAEGGRQVAETSCASAYAHQPQISPDGRYLAVIGTTCIYLYDLATLGPPRRMAPASVNGGFRSFAFHPNGRTMAIIHKGPSLVKLYDLDTLKLTTKFQWKVGAHNAVAFSPDGTLAAAGGEAGKIVVWDVDD